MTELVLALAGAAEMLWASFNWCALTMTSAMAQAARMETGRDEVEKLARLFRLHRRIGQALLVIAIILAIVKELA